MYCVTKNTFSVYSELSSAHLITRQKNILRKYACFVEEPV